MEERKDMTTEELQELYETLGTELKARRKAEAEERNARLKAEREERYNEVVEAYKAFEGLRSKYVDDYGYFTFEQTARVPSLFNWLV